jgi:hypothetical protein
MAPSADDAASDEAASDEAASEPTEKVNRELLAKREAVQVLVRVRPHLSSEDVSQSFVSVKEGSVSVSGTGGRCYSSKVDRTFPQDTCQSEVFSHIVPLLDSVLAGFNASVLAYGQTGSGALGTSQMHRILELFLSHAPARTLVRAVRSACLVHWHSWMCCRQDVYDERAAYSGAGRLWERRRV